MGALKIVLTVFFIVVCIALVVLVLMQEGKSAGLGAISGITETYWGKNKGRSMEGRLVKFTTILAVLFMGLAVILNLNIFSIRIIRLRKASSS
jgi:preprotein translocase subunit SecG